MRKAILSYGVGAVLIAGGVALLATGPGAAAPVLSGAAAVKSAVATDVTEARWRRYWGWRRYGGWRLYGYNSGCHIAGGYYRPNACW